MEFNSTFLIFIIFISAFFLGFALSFWRLSKTIQLLKTEQAVLKTQLEAEKNLADTKSKESDEQIEALNNTFATLSQKALKSNSDDFLKLANENLQQFNLKAEHEFQKKEQSVQNIVKPIKDLLEKSEKQIHQMELERKESLGSISKYLENMTETQIILQNETKKLAQALRKPEVRGQWGEITLKRLIELAGMINHCDFIEQEHKVTEDGTFRPDVVIKLPGSGEVVIDVKTPIDSYISAAETTGLAEKKTLLAAHTQHFKSRIKDLSSKRYWKQFERSPEFVIMFVPGEQFLNAALENDHHMIEDAIKLKVILATPNSLVALLRTIAFGWNLQKANDNAEIIRNLGAELYNRLITFSRHLSKIGKSLDTSVDSYNSAVGSFERQILSSARKMEDLGVSPKSTLTEPNEITEKIRQLKRLDSAPNKTNIQCIEKN